MPPLTHAAKAKFPCKEQTRGSLRVYTRRFATRAEAREAIFEFVEVFYNRCRRHSTLGYVSPIEFEMKFIEESKVREYEAA